MPLIVVDIDFTLANGRPVIEKLAEKYSIMPDSWDRHWKDKARKEKEEMIRDWYLLAESMDMEPVEHAKEALEKIASKGYEIVYLTARYEAFHADGREINMRRLTEEWLERHGFPDGRLMMNSHEKGLVFKSRSLASLERERPAYGIGDTKEDMMAYMSAGLKPILFHNHLHSFYNKPELFFSPEIIHMEDWRKLEDLIKANPFMERYVRFVIDREELEFSATRISEAMKEAKKAFGKFVMEKVEFREEELMPGLVREYIIIHGRKLHNS